MPHASSVGAMINAVNRTFLRHHAAAQAIVRFEPTWSGIELVEIVRTETRPYWRH